MAHEKLGMTGAAIGILILILDSNSASQAAAEGIDTCIRTVIPSLFPFFLLSGYLTGGVTGGKYMARFFHCPDHSGTILLSGFLGGYPVGAKLASDHFRAGIITKKLADRLLWFCSQAGPSFLFGIIGPQMGSIRYAWLLWFVQIASALCVSWLLPRRMEHAPGNTEQRSMTLTDAMHSALRAMASVCGWVIIFRVVISFLNRWILWLLPEALQILLCGLLELTGGSLMLHQISDPQLRFLLAAVMINFGGLCVLMQTHSVTEGLDRRGYFLGKCLQTLLSMLYSLLTFGQFWILIPLLGIFFLRFLIPKRKKSSIPAQIGV